LRIVVPLYEDRKFNGNYNFRNVQESGFGSPQSAESTGIDASQVVSYGPAVFDFDPAVS